MLMTLLCYPLNTKMLRRFVEGWGDQYFTQSPQPRLYQQSGQPCKRMAYAEKMQHPRQELNQGHPILAMLVTGANHCDTRLPMDSQEKINNLTKNVSKIELTLAKQKKQDRMPSQQNSSQLTRKLGE